MTPDSFHLASTYLPTYLNLDTQTSGLTLLRPVAPSRSFRVPVATVKVQAEAPALKKASVF